jgi:hypothetical protein
MPTSLAILEPADKKLGGEAPRFIRYTLVYASVQRGVFLNP